MKKSVLTNYPVLMIAAFMLFMTAGLGYAATYYVWRDNPSPVAPFDTWAKAATNIQLAVDASVSGDTVLVTNGVYDTGGTNDETGYMGSQLTNRVYILYKAITMRSMNGPGLTIIKGAEAPGGGCGIGAVRCVYINQASASLIGFTLTGGYTQTTGTWWGGVDITGGGVYFAYANGVVSNCVISGNTAYNGGGGASFYTGGMLNNCTVVSNTALSYVGGGAYFYDGGTMNNCTVVGNSAMDASWGEGGGVYLDKGCTINNCIVANNRGVNGGGVKLFNYTGGSTMNNCTVVSNTATASTGGVVIFYSGYVVNNCIIWGNSSGDSISNLNENSSGLINYTCSGPAQAGTGNIGSDPMLTDIAAGNYRLTKGSPCINTGTNFSWMTDSTDVRSKDLDGHSRIDRFSGIVDMGAYEYLPRGTIFRVR